MTSALNNLSSSFKTVPCSAYDKDLKPDPVMYQDPSWLVCKHGGGGFLMTAAGASLVAIVTLVVLTYFQVIPLNVLSNATSAALAANVEILINLGTPAMIGLFTGFGVISFIGLYTIYKGFSLIKEAVVFDWPASKIESPYTDLTSYIAPWPSFLKGEPALISKIEQYTKAHTTKQSAVVDALPDSYSYERNSAYKQLQKDYSDYIFDRNKYINACDETITSEQKQSFFKNLAVRDLAVTKENIERRRDAKNNPCCGRLINGCIDGLVYCFNR